MIYKFAINIAEKREQPILKIFYLSADNDNAFYRRCLDQYRAQKENIEILECIPAEQLDINNKPQQQKTPYQPPKVGVDPIAEESAIVASQAVQMIQKVRGVSAAEIEAKKQDGWFAVETYEPLQDLKVALSLYKKVKLYYQRTGAKKRKLYVILCQNKINESNGKKSQKTASNSSSDKKQKKAKKSTPKRSG